MIQNYPDLKCIFANLSISSNYKRGIKSLSEWSKIIHHEPISTLNWLVTSVNWIDNGPLSWSKSQRTKKNNDGQVILISPCKKETKIWHNQKCWTFVKTYVCCGVPILIQPCIVSSDPKRERLVGKLFEDLNTWQFLSKSNTMPWSQQYHSNTKKTSEYYSDIKGRTQKKWKVWSFSIQKNIDIDINLSLKGNLKNWYCTCPKHINKILYWKGFGI